MSEVQYHETAYQSFLSLAKFKTHTVVLFTVDNSMHRLCCSGRMKIFACSATVFTYVAEYPLGGEGMTSKFGILAVHTLQRTQQE